MTINEQNINKVDIGSTIQTMAESLGQHLADRQADNPAMIGIHTGGVWVAEQLHQIMGLKDPLGVLDISFYRDDFTRIGLNPRVRPSSVPFNVEDRHIILVDDVIQSGRTIRAAMNEIFDFGRPASITLVSLIDRSGRELPIQADIIGHRPQLAADQHIRLEGPSPLSLTIGTAQQTPARESQD